MERSLRLLPYWWVLRWVWLGEAIWVVYLVETRGLTIGQVLLFDAVFFGSSLLSEVPTGVVADRYGRKTSMVSGSLVISVGFLVFALAGTLPVLLSAYVLFGVGSALMSGADDAYLFDALRAVGRVREFPAVAGRLNGLMTLTIAGFTIIGGLMATVTPLSWPIVASGVLSLTAASLAWRLEEPPREPGNAADSFFATGLSASRRVLAVPSLRWAATLGALPWVAGFVAFTVWQPVLIGYEVPVAAFGWIAAGMMLVAATGGWSADWFSRRLGMSGVLLLLPVIGAIGLLGGSGGMRWVVPLFGLAPFAQNALHPVTTVYISRRVPGQRARDGALVPAVRRPVRDDLRHAGAQLPRLPHCPRVRARRDQRPAARRCRRRLAALAPRRRPRARTRRGRRLRLDRRAAAATLGACAGASRPSARAPRSPATRRSRPPRCSSCAR